MSPCPNPNPTTGGPAAHDVHQHSATLKRLEKSSGSLAAQAIARMDETLPWYRAMPPENRSWIGLVAQAGIAAFTEWFRRPDAPQAISTDVFGTAPRELTRAITLRQTVEMVRTTIEVMESAIDEVAAPGDESVLREALLVYAREIAFATAQVYAQAAEARGAWTARLESLVVNAGAQRGGGRGAVSRAAALGWNSPEHVCVVLGTAPDGDSELTVEAIRRAARHAKLQVLTRGARGPARGHRGRQRQPSRRRQVADRAVRRRPVVAGPVVPDLLAGPRSAQAAAAGLKACSAWQDAPRPALADDLLPERAIAGDPGAREQLVGGDLQTVGGGGLGPPGNPECLPGAGEQPGRRGEDALRSPEHRALPAPTCDRRHRLVAIGCTIRVHTADRPHPGASGRR
ncbi:fatty acid biosynthesis transcriptional regulator FasR [Streptomyces echinatus]